MKTNCLIRSHRSVQNQKKRGRPKLYNPPEKSLIADDYGEWPEHHAEAKLNADLRRTLQPQQKQKRARSRSKNRSAAEIEEEKRIAEAKEQEAQTVAKTKGRPKKIITPEEEAQRAEATRARSRSKNRSSAELEEEKRVAQEQAALLQEIQEKAKGARS